LEVSFIFTENWSENWSCGKWIEFLNDLRLVEVIRIGSVLAICTICKTLEKLNNLLFVQSARHSVFSNYLVILQSIKTKKKSNYSTSMKTKPSIVNEPKTASTTATPTIITSFSTVATTTTRNLPPPVSNIQMQEPYFCNRKSIFIISLCLNSEFQKLWRYRKMLWRCKKN